MWSEGIGFIKVYESVHEVSVWQIAGEKIAQNPEYIENILL